MTTSIENIYSHTRRPGDVIIKTRKNGTTGISCSPDDAVKYLFSHEDLVYAHEWYDKACLESDGVRVIKAFLDLDKIQTIDPVKTANDIAYEFNYILSLASQSKYTEGPTVIPEIIWFGRISANGLSLHVFAANVFVEVNKLGNLLDFTKTRMLENIPELASDNLDFGPNKASRCHFRLPYARKETDDLVTYNSVLVHSSVFGQIYNSAEPQEVFDDHVGGLVSRVKRGRTNKVLDDIRKSIIIEDSLDGRDIMIIKRAYSEISEELENVKAELLLKNKLLSKSGATEISVKNIYTIIETLESRITNKTLAKKRGAFNELDEPDIGEILNDYAGKLSTVLALHALSNAKFIPEIEAKALLTRCILMANKYQGNQLSALARAESLWDITSAADLEKISPVGAFMKLAKAVMPDTEYTRLSKQINNKESINEIISNHITSAGKSRIDMNLDYEFDNFTNDVTSKKLKTPAEIISAAGRVIAFIGVKCFIKRQPKSSGRTCILEPVIFNELRIRLDIPMKIDIGTEEPKTILLSKIISENTDAFSYSTAELVIDQLESSDDLSKIIQKYNRPRFVKSNLHWSMREDVNLVMKHIEQVICRDTASYMYMLKWLSEAIIDTRKHETMLFVFSEAQGVGKGLIFEHLVSGLVGENYAKGAKISEVEKGHNGFVEDSVYVHIDEIGAFSMDSKELGEQLKQMSNKNVVMCDKYMKQRRTRQYCNYVFNSNNVTGIPIKSGDRRFSCFEARFTDFTDIEYYNKLSDICDISDTRNPGFASAFLEMLVDIRSGLDGKFTRGEYDAVNLHKPLKNAARDRVISCNDIYNTFAAEFKTTSIHSDKPELDYGYIVDEFIKFATSRGCSAIQKIQDYKLIKDIMTAIPLRDEILGWTGLIKVRTDVRLNDTRIVFHKIGLESVFPKKRSSE